MVGPSQISAVAIDSNVLVLIRGRDTRWWKGCLLQLNLLIFIILLTSMTVGYDSSMMNGLQSLKIWQEYFNHPHGGQLGLFSAIQSIGSVAGLRFAPYLADRFSRRYSMIFGCVVMILGAGVQTGARNVGMFIGARFCVVFGTAIAGVAAPMLVTELAFPTHRAPLTALYNTSWLLGSMVAAWTTYGTFRIDNDWSWRIPSVLQALPRGPRVIQKYHCHGDGSDPLLQFEMAEITDALGIEKEAMNSSTYRALFSTKANLRRLRIIIPLAFFSQWSGNGIVSFYLTLVLNGIGITSTGSQTLINGILQLWNYAGAFLGSLVVDRVGRRLLFLTSFEGMCLSFTAWTICYATYAKSPDEKPNTAAGHGVLAFIFVYYAFYVIALTPLVVAYPIEILPYSIRAKGVTILQFALNLSVIFNQYVNPVALERIGWKYYVVYCVWLAAEFIYCYIFFIETKGKNGPLSLEEIAALFDDPRERHRLNAAHAAYELGSNTIELDSKSKDVQVENKV